MSFEQGLHLRSIKVIKGVLQSLNFRREGKYWTCNMKNLLVFVFTFSMLLMHVSGKFLVVFSIANASACDTKEMQQKVGLAVIFFIFNRSCTLCLFHETVKQSEVQIFLFRFCKKNCDIRFVKFDEFDEKLPFHTKVDFIDRFFFKFWHLIEVWSRCHNLIFFWLISVCCVRK